jgi:hypothetical protein
MEILQFLTLRSIGRMQTHQTGGRNAPEEFIPGVMESITTPGFRPDTVGLVSGMSLSAPAGRNTLQARFELHRIRSSG